MSQEALRSQNDLKRRYLHPRGGCTPTLDRVHANTFSLAATEMISALKKSTNYIFSNQFGILGFYGDYLYARQAVWSSFMSFSVVF